MFGETKVPRAPSSVASIQYSGSSSRMDLLTHYIWFTLVNEYPVVPSRRIRLPKKV